MTDPTPLDSGPDWDRRVAEARAWLAARGTESWRAQPRKPLSERTDAEREADAWDEYWQRRVAEAQGK